MTMNTFRTGPASLWIAITARSLSTAQTIASWVAFAVLFASVHTAPSSEASEPREIPDIRGPKPSFPRLMGMNIGAKNYDDPAYQSQLARLDVVILGFYKGWKPGYGMAKVVRNLKELSGGKILVGQYTILNECEGPVLK
jgi:hypothetical protein